ncbi:hypothetical protein FEK35_23365 [Nocardia cyriacigeorgica]|uniref:Class I SAM-dependent methyltransferase n=1 Tax=Nocardia cyriacigeorgica TaxID=135487 RepID=A0A5R8P8W7_9NOCA|nr:hypothetical protein [Nocardia cyriacigeorgica]TLG01801.1 hypothetical protein FEK35_23365 [Nocardia cyriacigeorgica]
MPSSAQPRPPRESATTGAHRKPRRHPVPSTIWAAGPDPINRTDRWPAPIVERAATEFSQPGDQILLATPISAHPQPRAHTRAPSVAAGPYSALEALGRHAAILPIFTEWDTPPQGHEHTAGADLILASLLPTHPGDPVVDRLAALAAQRLRAGGVLTVLTRSAHASDGTLVDPTGAVVHAAQTCDLLYLSHIVAVPIHNDMVTPDITPPPNDDRSAPRHQVVHTDLLVFLQAR